MGKNIIVSGMRPTGKLHLGNYFGALVNWIRLQEEEDCLFFVADWHALTTGYEEPSEIPENIQNLVLDWISAGLDPEKCCIFLQSDIKQHAELHLAFSLITPLSWLTRCPTYKDQLDQLGDRDIRTYGFLGYPCLQAADILLYKADGVPVGEDQLPHLEITREIARRFNFLFQCSLFPEPKSILNEAKVLPGIDGRKMSKSYQNEIALSDSLEEVRGKVMRMVTDPSRIRKDDPGHPDICSVFSMYKVIAPDLTEEIKDSCSGGKTGCVACKRKLGERLCALMAPIAERRQDLVKKPGQVREILQNGSQTARARAEQTMESVKHAMKLKLPD
ncbi:MAG TPA: tryptophan--tRNA ligase [Clostridiales bacterium]|nr:tryptophan--tRNA ligase [Clostridiales bacterium]